MADAFPAEDQGGPLLLYTDLAFVEERPKNLDRNQNRKHDRSNSNAEIVGEACDSDGGGRPGGDSRLVRAVARSPFVFRERGIGTAVSLNAEFFGDVSWPRMVCFVPGVCESAETWTVQHLARICASKEWRLAVLEPEGHGLSGGVPRGLLRPGKWERYVGQVTAFCGHALEVDRMQKERQQQQQQQQQQQRQREQEPTEETYKLPRTRFVLAGASMGGALAAYASQRILEDSAACSKQPRTDRPLAQPAAAVAAEQHASFVGTLLLSPAVGVDPSVVPPALLVAALSVLSWLAPGVGLEGVTPTEDPSHYDCPASTKRNYAGPWPLGTSKLLLDATTVFVPGDVREGSLNLPLAAAAAGAALPHATLVVSGVKDPVVPIGAVREFVEHTNSHAAKRGCLGPGIGLAEIENGDHSLLAPQKQKHSKGQLNATKKKTLATTTGHVEAFLERCGAAEGSS
ncbi:unnamed protein product [Pseudo-nitzschia multistriata]|uniref:Serine aminopeptidase S33 domain-containing protein n=1 Tax=Pseudo-nitzschia multistriata TaxID=183589 RepID=A0A448Z102_9STRA|nr:unnamed protein product [Pseudo-nitzschia multistriata]